MGCRNVLIGCGIFALLATVALAIGAFFLVRNVAPAFGEMMQLTSKIQNTVLGAQNIEFKIKTTNGKTLTQVQLKVPFDPNSANQAHQAAQQVAKLVQGVASKAKLPTALEVKLYQETPEGKLEHTYRFDLSKPLPASRQGI